MQGQDRNDEEVWLRLFPRDCLANDARENAALIGHSGTEHQQHLADAASLFLAYVKGQERPFRQLADYLFMLRAKGWGQGEIEAVQRAIVGEMTRPTFKH